MDQTTPLRAVALDGGTTNTRARLVEGDRVIATARRSVGVRDTAFTGSAGPLAEAVRGCLDELESAHGPLPDRIAAAGMLTSDVGLLAVPHVPAPAGLAELARGVVEAKLDAIGGRTVAFVPGVRTSPSAGPGGWLDADVMRGEECETFGAWRLEGEPSGRLLYLWPGSHTKLVAFEDGRIVGSVTTLAGELWAAVAGHTLLAASLREPPPARPDPEAMELGRRAAIGRGLGRAAFAVRLADLGGALEPAARAAFWLGAAIGDDVEHLARHPWLSGGVPARVRVGGREPQRSAYAAWLGERLGEAVGELDGATCEAASAVGALAIAGRSALSRGR